MQTKKVMKQHNIMCKISLQIRQNIFLKTNSKSLFVNPKTYRKLSNHSDNLINLVDVVGAFAEYQMAKHDFS